MTIQEFAAVCGVSTATVSRAFSNKGYVQAETRERILQLAKEYSFQPKPYRTHSGGEFQSSVGVVIPDIRNDYYLEVIRGIEEVMDSHGVQVLICNTDEDTRKEIRSLSTLQKQGVKGVITVPVSEAERYNADFLVELNQKIPVVLLDRELRGGSIDGVFMDNYNSAYQSAQVLVHSGHQHIAIISGPTTSTSGLSRLNGYLAALADNGLPVREEYILYGDFKFDRARELTHRLLDKQRKVTAIFAANSRMAQGSLLALAQRGVAVPQDMAFLSCGKLGASYGGISTVEYPTGSIGAECAKMLLEKIRTGKRGRASLPKKRITFDMELVLRGSQVYPTSRKNKTTEETP